MGTTILGFRKSYGYVAGVGVRRKHRRRKVGSQLMDRAEEVARARGKAWAVLDVEGENRPAIELYQHRGYESIQTTEWLRGDDLAQIASHSVRPSESRLVGRSEAKAAAEWCRARIPTPFSSIVPPTPGTLTHLEVIAQMRGVKRRAWAVGPPGGTHAYLRGYPETAAVSGDLVSPRRGSTSPAKTSARLSHRRSCLDAVKGQHVRGGGGPRSRAIRGRRPRRDWIPAEAHDAHDGAPPFEARQGVNVDGGERRSVRIELEIKEAHGPPLPRLGYMRWEWDFEAPEG